MKRNYELMYTQASGQTAGIASKLDDAKALMHALTVQADEHTKIIDENMNLIVENMNLIDEHKKLIDYQVNLINTHVKSIKNIHIALKNLVEKFGDNSDALIEVHRSIAEMWDESE